jgi:hypothetical protein
MNRVIRDNYPVERLPDDLRQGAEPGAIASVTVDIELPAPRISFHDIFDDLHQSRVLSDDPVMRVRALREEWDDRARFLEQIERGGSR